MTPVRPFTAEWAAAFCAALEESAAYREAAARWAWPVAFVLRAAPPLGWARDVRVVLALDHGRCRGATVVEGEGAAESPRAPFVFRGDYAAWKRVVRGEVDVVAAVMRGEIALEGSVFQLMPHVGAARALLDVARTIPVLLPDEAPEPPAPNG